MAFLQLLNVSKQYDGQASKAVNDISFSLKRGEILSVVGENGSGKTALLRLIGGFEDADSGEVLLMNEKVTGPSDNLVPGHPEIKMLAQDLKLKPKHTIIENIGYDLRRYVEEFQHERITYLINLFRLQGLENKLPAQLSGGQQQRAALASALAEESSILLLDEPFSSLDVMLKDEIRNKVIRQARKDGDTLIFITHEVKDALSLSDTIAVMKAGKIIQMDNPHMIYEKPKDEYVACLFGNINVLIPEDLIKIFPTLKDQNIFNGDKSKKVCFRPEHISICNEGNEMCIGMVKNSAYMGDHYELEVEVKASMLKVKSLKPYADGEKVCLQIDSENIHFLDEKAEENS